MSGKAAPQYQEYALHDASDTASIPPAYDDTNAPHPDDLVDAKKSFDSDDAEDEVLQSDAGSVMLDLFKTKDFKYGTRIVSRSSLPGGIQAGEVLYTVATHGALNWRGGVVTFQRGDGRGPTAGSTKRYQSGEASTSASASETVENPPYAELSVTKLRLAESPESGAPLEESSRRKFLHSQKWWSAKNRFNLGDIEYRLKAKWNGADYELYLPPKPKGDDGLLLAVFKHKTWSRTTRGTLEIFPSAIFTSSASGPQIAPKEALLFNGRPTWLLDVVILAEHAYKADRDAQAGAAAASSSAA